MLIEAIGVFGGFCTLALVVAMARDAVDVVRGWIDARKVAGLADDQRQLRADTDQLVVRAALDVTDRYRQELERREDRCQDCAADRRTSGYYQPAPLPHDEAMRLLLPGTVQYRDGDGKVVASIAPEERKRVRAALEAPASIMVLGESARYTPIPREPVDPNLDPDVDYVEEIATVGHGPIRWIPHTKFRPGETGEEFLGRRERVNQRTYLQPPQPEKPVPVTSNPALLSPTPADRRFRQIRDDAAKAEREWTWRDHDLYGIVSDSFLQAKYEGTE